MMKTTAVATAFAVTLFAGAFTAQPAKATNAGLDIEAATLSGSYLAGRIASKLRDNEIAARYFRRALKDDPNNPVLIERAFILEVSAGNMIKAEEYADQVLGFNRQHRMAHVVLGLREVRLGRHEQARRHFKRASFTPVGELTSGLLIAWTFAAEGKLAEALEALNALDRNDSFRNFKSFHAALIADLLGSPSRAEAFYKSSYENAGTSLRVVQSYGSYLIRTNRPDKAREVFDKYLERSTGNPLVEAARKKLEEKKEPGKFIASAKAGMAEAMFSIASALSDEQSIDVSLIYTQLSLSVLPDNPVTQTLLGEIYQDTKRYEKAIEAFDAISRSSPLRPSAVIEIASNLDSLDKTDEAIKRLNDLIATDPVNYNAYLTRGNIERAREKWLDAATSYTRALELAKGPESGQWTVLYFRAIAYERSKQWEKAEADFLKALEYRPEQPAILNYLGYSWIEKGMHLERALGMVQKAVDLKPNDGYIVDSLGWAYYQLKQYDKAVIHLERAVELKPQDPTINDHLGDAYWRVGRKLEAGFQWRHALDNKPEEKNIEEIKRKLKEGLPEDTSDPADPASAGKNTPKKS